MLPDDTRFITDEASLRALHFQPMLRVRVFGDSLAESAAQIKVVFALAV